MKMWIARDYNNGLYLYFDKPKCADEDYFYSLHGEMLIPHQLFPEVTFENSPQQVEIKLVKEK
jgi:hypothetical protein